jgi:hypothetical protein
MQAVLVLCLHGVIPPRRCLCRRLRCCGPPRRSHHRHQDDTNKTNLLPSPADPLSLISITVVSSLRPRRDLLTHNSTPHCHLPRSSSISFSLHADVYSSAASPLVPIQLLQHLQKNLSVVGVRDLGELEGPFFNCRIT